MRLQNWNVIHSMKHSLHEYNGKLMAHSYLVAGVVLLPRNMCWLLTPSMLYIFITWATLQWFASISTLTVSLSAFVVFRAALYERSKICHPMCKTGIYDCPDCSCHVTALLCSLSTTSEATTALVNNTVKQQTARIHTAMLSMHSAWCADWPYSGLAPVANINTTPTLTLTLTWGLILDNVNSTAHSALLRTCHTTTGNQQKCTKSVWFAKLY